MKVSGCFSKIASMLPIGVFGANLFVQRRSRAVLLVVGENLAFAWCRPFLSRLDTSGQSVLHLGQIQDAVAGKHDLATGGRDCCHKVVSFAHGSIGVGSKGPLLTLKVSITDRNRSRGMKIASRRYRGFSGSQGTTPTETGIEIRTRRIGAFDGLIGGPASARSTAVGALDLATTKQPDKKIEKAHRSLRPPSTQGDGR